METHDYYSFPFTNDIEGLIQIGIIYENIVGNNIHYEKWKKKSLAFNDITFRLTLIIRLNINHKCI